MSVRAIAWAWQQPLRCTTKIVLLALADHADEKGYCWPRTKTLMACCGLSRASVFEQLNQLHQQGLITKTARYNAHGNRTSNLYQLQCNTSRTEASRPAEKRDSPVERQGSPASGCPLVHEMDGIYNRHHDPSKETINKQITRFYNTSHAIKPLFAYWQHIMQRPQAKLDRKRYQSVAAALQLGYKVDELKTAIKGCRLTPFNMGDNPYKQPYNDIALIFRDAEHIERFIKKGQESDGSAADEHPDTRFEGVI